jgi:triacylglycerol lipase
MPWSYPTGFNANTAIGYANFVQQAYFQYYMLTGVPPEFGYPPFVFTLPTGYKLLYNLWWQRSDYFGYVAGTPANSPTQLVIALRGTESWYEWLSDLMESAQVNCPVQSSQGSVHEGFSAYYQGLQYFHQPTVAPPIQSPVSLSKVLANAKSVIVTGHSLGAALGTLLTLDIALNIAPKIACTVSSYNFGSPVVGDPVFANFFNGQVGEGKQISANYRVANGMDVIPNLPSSVFYPPDSSQEYDYMQVQDYCPVDSGILSIPSDAHSLSNYVIGLRNIANGREGKPIERPASAVRYIPKWRRRTSEQAADITAA